MQRAFARELMDAADGFSFDTGAFLRGFFVGMAQFDFAEDALTLQFALERFERLFDIIISNVHSDGQDFILDFDVLVEVGGL